jgi:nitrite reductase (NADH) large subunit
MKVVIIGSGIAAVEAAIRLRECNADVQIDIFSKEKELPYRRPALTRMIAETLNDNQLYIHPENFYQKNNINLHLGYEVVAIERSQKKILMDNGQEKNYDKLLIATGGRCFIPPIQGTELPQVMALREKSDLDRLQNYLSDGLNKIAVIGGGLLGLEIADNLSKVGAEITVIEACPTMLPKQLDAEGAELLVKAMESNSKVKTRYGTFVSHITGHHRVEGLVTQKNEHIDCDLVIISAGVKCNVELAHKAELLTERAIEVNEFMQTSDPDIYAAGDCACSRGCFIGMWNPAKEQGAVAGVNMAGQQKEFTPGIYGARLVGFGTKLFSIGDIGLDDGEYLEVSRKNEIKLQYRKLFFKKEKLTGGILLGDIGNAVKLQKAVEEQYSFEQAEAAGLICT